MFQFQEMSVLTFTPHCGNSHNPNFLAVLFVEVKYSHYDASHYHRNYKHEQNVSQSQSWMVTQNILGMIRLRNEGIIIMQVHMYKIRDTSKLLVPCHAI